jgi:hypothetical protein
LADIRLLLDVFVPENKPLVLTSSDGNSENFWQNMLPGWRIAGIVTTVYFDIKHDIN